MSADIKCPNCGFAFPMEAAVSEEYKRNLREQMAIYKRQKDEELERQKQEFAKKEKESRDILENKEQEFLKTLNEEKKKIRQSAEEELRKSIAGDYENQLRLLKQSNEENDEKLKEARKKELEYLKKEQALVNKEQELEITLQKKLIEERQQLTEQIRKEETEKVSIKETGFQLRLRELEKQLEDQKKLAEEMKRKAEQGSMQLQGEAQELLLEEILRENFPLDQIMEVGKGVEGADCIQVVRNHAGHEYGKIIFESKRAKSWNSAWVEKLRNDMRHKQADLAILVTQVFPKNMHSFGERDGVWICSFKEVGGLTAALRSAIIRIEETKRSEENKGEKMLMLYNFLTGTEFRQQIEAIVEGFMSLKQSIVKERIQMEKIWKEREKQLEKALISASGMYGSIRGIAGSSVHTIPLLEGDTENDEQPEE